MYTSSREKHNGSNSKTTCKHNPVDCKKKFLNNKILVFFHLLSPGLSQGIIYPD